MHEEKNLCKQADFIESVEIYPEKLDNGYNERSAWKNKNNVSLKDIETEMK